MPHPIEKSLSPRKAYIAALRLPLAVLIVLIHAYNAPWRAVDWGGAAWVPRFLSNQLPTFAVPLFFALSGYLFFCGMQRFRPSTYCAKLRRRGLTLLLPYLVWNVLAFALYALQDHLAGRPTGQPFTFDIFWGSKEMTAAHPTALGYAAGATTAPILTPLWFVRDLMVMVVASPMLYVLLRRLPGWLLAVLWVVCWQGSLWWPCWGGLSLMAPTYFGLGAWFGVRGLDLAEGTRRLHRPSLVLSLGLLAAMPFVGSGGWVDWLGPAGLGALYPLTAGVCALWAAAGWSKCHKTGGEFSRSGFFLYAAHTILLLPLASAATRYVGEGAGPFITILLFILCPVAAVLLCLLAYQVLRRLFGRWAGPLTGVYEPYRRLGT